MKKALVCTFLGLMGTIALSAGQTKPTPVEVWAGGDDGLTQRLRQETEKKLKGSPDFVLSTGKKAGTLVVTIPTHIAWKQVGARTRLHYGVEFSSSDGSPLGKSEGSCWEDDMAACAAEIYRAAQNADDKLH